MEAAIKSEVETEHYDRPGFDPSQDALLAKLHELAIWSRSTVNSSTCFGYEPPGLTQIEIMKDHEKFSGRTVALPFIPTVGACTGKVVALASTRTSPKPVPLGARDEA